MQQATQRASDYFKRVTVTSSNFADCLLAWGFTSQGISLLNEASSGTVVEYSFNGTDLCGDLDPSEATTGLIFDNRGRDRVFLRLKSGTSASVRVETWAE
jgi:hypothetical protein